MTAGVVVVGPVALRGPGMVDQELATIALDGIDDDLALVDDRAVRTEDLWREVLGRAANGSRAALVVIHPSWWANSRVDRVRAAALASAADVVMTARSELVPAAASVELAPDLVVVHNGTRRRALARTAGLVDAVLSCLAGVPAVTIDVPDGLTPFGAGLSRALRAAGVDVAVVDDGALARAAVPRNADGNVVRRRLTPRAAAAVGALGSACALAAAAIGVDDGKSAPAQAWLVEGRVAVEIPARWAVERITYGPGSARVQVVSPDGAADVIHVTQSRIPESQTLDEAAEALRAALAAEPGGVFVDFTAPGERAERAAVTYREMRGSRRVDWTVLLDGGVRIAIGCQGAQTSAGPCDRAIRSAHTIDRK